MRTQEVTAEDFEELAQRVLDSTSKTFEAEPSLEEISDLVARVSKQLDQAITRFQPLGPKLDCKRGCSWCCHEIVLATVPEILAIYHHIQASFTEEQKTAFFQRLDEYESHMEGRRKRPFYFTKQACPFLVNSECSIYQHRPLVCRGRNSIDAEQCRMWKESPGDGGIVQQFVAQYLAYQSCERGMAFGFCGQFHSSRYELPRCLKLLFEDPSRAQRVIEGSAPFPAPVPPPKGLNFASDPTALLPAKAQFPGAKEAQRLVDFGRTQEAANLLPSNSLFSLFNRMRLPGMFSSYDQILESRTRMDQVLDELDQRPVNLREALVAMREHFTVSLPYQGLSVKALLEKQGRIFSKLVTMAYPDLCAPLPEKRRPGKFRVGYMSGALNLSNGSRWALGWIRNHGENLETYAFNWSRDDIGSQMWSEAADHYYRLEGDIQKAAAFIRDLDLDAIIHTDLGYRENDYILGNMRLARAQCTAWGTPVTSGLPAIDYYLSSDLMEPEDAQDEYTEQLVRLPRSGLCYPKPRSQMPKKPYPRAGQSFIPLMAQNLRKWTPQRDDLLRKIFERQGRPLRFVAVSEGVHTDIFSARLKKAGIPHEMLPWTNQLNFAGYLQSADVSYDPIDWSGGNTTIEALSYGIPVVTLPGPYMRGRHSLAFLQIAGGTGLIAKDEDDYLDLIFDRDRQQEAMKELDADCLYEDLDVVKALDDFLMNTMVG